MDEKRRPLIGLSGPAVSALCSSQRHYNNLIVEEYLSGRSMPYQDVYIQEFVLIPHWFPRRRSNRCVDRRGKKNRYLLWEFDIAAGEAQVCKLTFKKLL